jgi:hypothetical protein
MLTPTNYSTDTALFQKALEHFSKDGMKTTINQPTGNFFYDPWKLKDEYKGTAWEDLYKSLPVNKGEARIIVLEPAQCYQTHADIDDRYHLNISGEDSYIIDLVREQMHKLSQDGKWYYMDAGYIHSAANFGRLVRVQLVVRQLLKRNKLKDPVDIAISTTMDNHDHARFLFDNSISPWLNEANKIGCITDFSYSSPLVKFTIERNKIDSLKSMLPTEFKLL